MIFNKDSRKMTIYILFYIYFMTHCKDKNEKETLCERDCYIETKECIMFTKPKC
jgi:hypothetical protein